MIGNILHIAMELRRQFHTFGHHLLMRYVRQIALSGFGKEGQEALARSTVLVAGAGGLGAPVALYLAAAGVGRLVLCDSDKVELSNLNRQLLYRTADLGKNKAPTAGKNLEALNPEIRVESHALHLDFESLASIGQGVDLVADCLDNVQGRLELNRWCVEQGIPLMHGGIEGWGGQLSFLQPPHTPCMACLFSGEGLPENPPPVMGAVAGTVGSMQALEILRYLGTGEAKLKGRMLLLDGQNMSWSETPLEKLDDCPVCNHLKI